MERVHISLTKLEEILSLLEKSLQKKEFKKADYYKNLHGREFRRLEFILRIHPTAARSFTAEISSIKKKYSVLITLVGHEVKILGREKDSLFIRPAGPKLFNDGESRYIDINT